MRGEQTRQKAFGKIQDCKKKENKPELNQKKKQTNKQTNKNKTKTQKQKQNQNHLCC